MAVEQPAPRTPNRRRLTPFPKPLQPPTKEEAEAANRGDYREGRITGFIKRHPLISGGTAAGVAAAAAYESVPAFHQAVDSNYHDIMQKLGVEIVVPPTFGNKAGSGVIGDNNTYPLSPEEAKKANLQPVGNETSLTFLFPFQLPKGAKVQYEKGIGIPKPGPAEMVPTEDRKSQEEAVAKYEELKRKGIESKIDFVLPKDTVVYLPFDGYVFISMGREKFNEDPTKSTGLIAVFYDQEQNRTYEIRIFALDSGNQGYLNSLSTSLQLPSDYSLDILRGDSWKQWPKVEKGKPLLKTIADNQTLALTIEAYEGDKIGTGTNDKASSVLTPRFLTTTDTGNQKLLVLEK